MPKQSTKCAFEASRATCTSKDQGSCRCQLRLEFEWRRAALDPFDHRIAPEPREGSRSMILQRLDHLSLDTSVYPRISKQDIKPTHRLTIVSILTECQDQRMMCNHCPLSTKPAHANAVRKNRVDTGMVICTIIATFAVCNIKVAVDLDARIFIVVEEGEEQNDHIDFSSREAR